MADNLPQTDVPAYKEELAGLGSGSVTDRLHWKLVIQILFRCFPLLVPVWKPIVTMFVIVSFLALILIYPTAQLTDAFFNKILQGEPLTSSQAAILFMDVDIVTNAETYTGAVRSQVLRRLCWVVFGLFIFFTPIYLGLYYWQVWILQKINQGLRLEIFDRFQALSLRYHSDNKVGDAIYRIYQDSAMVTQIVNVLFLTPIPAIGRFLWSMAVVGIMNIWLALALIVLWPPLLLIGFFYSKSLRIGFRLARETNSALTSRIQESLSGIRVVKAYGAEAREQERFEKYSRAAFQEAFQSRNRFAAYKIVIFMVIGTVLIVGSGFGAYLAIENKAFFTAAFAFLMSFSVWNLGSWNFFKGRMGQGAGSARGLMGLWGRVQDIAIGLDRSFEILDTKPEVVEAPHAIDMPKFKESVVFENVSFRYKTDGPLAVDGVSLEARAGTITAIVGPTGSGKSTLVTLLLRLYERESGTIKIDGTDIRDLKIKSLPKNISIALQENMLFGNTIRENIRYAVPQASDLQVRYAAGVACADEFISKMSNGYDTMLGERGTKLSTGQRQRLSIARAIIKDGPILVLDEPTSSLDAETELKVLTNLVKWGQGRVIFLITHRLSTIRRADKIAFMQNGKMIEFGSYNELMVRSEGAYKKMVESEEGTA